MLFTVYINVISPKCVLNYYSSWDEAEIYLNKCAKEIIWNDSKLHSSNDLTIFYNIGQIYSKVNQN